MTDGQSEDAPPGRLRSPEAGRAPEPAPALDEPRPHGHDRDGAQRPRGHTDVPGGPAPAGLPAPAPPAEPRGDQQADDGARSVAEPPGTGVDVPAPPVGRGSRARARWREWALPALLAAVSVTASSAALLLDHQPAGSALGAASPTTPVLSARRAPELVAAPVANRRLGAELEEWLASSPPDTCLAVEVAGNPVFAHRVDEPLIGASTHKLLTAAALLLALGPDARLETRAVATGAPVDGVLAGDLFVIGGGDPLLATDAWREAFTARPRTINDIDQLARAVADAGVRRIEGSVVGDGSRYDDVSYHPIWPTRFREQGTIGSLGGLIVNDGWVYSPPTRAAAPDPALDAARVLTERLEAHGVAVAGAPRSGPAPEGATEVARLESPPVSEIAGQLVRDSDAETSDMAVKELGYRVAGEGSWAAGAQAMREVLGEAGVPLEGVEIVDGSGLAVENQVTCATLIEVLTLPETQEPIRAGLPVAGRSGTLVHRWQGTPVEGRLRAKTGTLRNVTSLAGEVDTLAGPVLTFAYVANVPDPGPISPEMVEQARLGDILLSYREGIDPDELGPVTG